MSDFGDSICWVLGGRQKPMTRRDIARVLGVDWFSVPLSASLVRLVRSGIVAKVEDGGKVAYVPGPKWGSRKIGRAGAVEDEQ